MRTEQEYQTVLELKSKGNNHSQISKITNIPRRTIIDWLAKGFQLKRTNNDLDLNNDYLIGKEKEYSFILGEYLGDGYISHSGRASKLRIFNTSKYTNLNNEIAQKMQVLFPKNKVTIYYPKNVNVAIITVYKKNLNILFPQDGVGKKHLRKIELLDWQKKIINKYPKDFLRGLFMSDGCRYLSSKKYIHYNFTNTSQDIINICKEYLEKCGVEYNYRKYQPKNINHSQKHTISIYKKKYTLILDSFIGEKK